MKTLQKFWAIFFIGIMSTFPLASVYAGGDYSSEDTAEKPDNFSETPDNNNHSEENKIEPPPVVNVNPENNFETPKEIPAPENENFNEPEEVEISEENISVQIDTGIIGDINGDNELNAVDLVVLQKYLNGDSFEVNETAADINGDGTVSMFDVHALLNLIKAENKGTGDVNNDGKINIYDVQTLTAYLANPKVTPINSGNADLNGDSRISTDDLKILRKVISELQK